MKTMLLSTDLNVKEQHLAVRNTVGWYDFTHKLIEVTGEDATEFMEKIFVSSISKVTIGRAKYTTMLNEKGNIIDDVIIFHMDTNKYWISTLYSKAMLKWFEEQKGDSDIEFVNITPSWRMYAVQGPNSKDLVNAVVDESIDEMRFFSIADNKINGIPVKVARSGFSGEKWGYEIYIDHEQKAMLEEVLAEEGKAFDAMHVTEMDVMIFTLSGEKGFVLMTDIIETNPFEVGFESSIDWDKEFIGKAALEQVKEEGPKRQLVGFTVDDKDALIYGGPHGNPIYKDGEKVGKATKFTYSYVNDTNIGYALIETGTAKIGDKVSINGYEAMLTEKRFVN